MLPSLGSQSRVQAPPSPQPSRGPPEPGLGCGQLCPRACPPRVLAVFMALPPCTFLFPSLHLKGLKRCETTSSTFLPKSTCSGDRPRGFLLAGHRLPQGRSSWLGWSLVWGLNLALPQAPAQPSSVLTLRQCPADWPAWPGTCHPPPGLLGPGGQVCSTLARDCFPGNVPLRARGWVGDWARAQRCCVLLLSSLSLCSCGPSVLERSLLLSRHRLSGASCWWLCKCSPQAPSLPRAPPQCPPGPAQPH